MAKIADELLKNQARAAMGEATEEANRYNGEPVDLLSVSRLMTYLNDTFDTSYPEN